MTVVDKKMDILAFVLPPALGSLGVVKLITSQDSQKLSLRIGFGCLAAIATTSYYICKKYAPKQHIAESKETSKDASTADRVDIDAIETEQISIKRQIQCASVFSATFMVTAYSSFSIPLALIETTGLKLALSARCASMAGLVLSAAIINVGMRRYPDAKKSTAVTDGAIGDKSMRIPMSFLQNTLEQLMLHLLASIGLATTLQNSAMQLVPALSSLFVLGRIIYYFTYSYLPVMRAFGFSMTIGPSTASLIFTLVSLTRTFLEL